LLHSREPSCSLTRTTIKSAQRPNLEMMPDFEWYDRDHWCGLLEYSKQNRDGSARAHQQPMESATTVGIMIWNLEAALSFKIERLHKQNSKT
jgi:hypothetical protein